MRKRLISMMLVFCMLFSLLPAQVLAAGTGKDAKTTSANPFTDVKAGSWYYDAVQYVYQHGIFSGTSATTFTPDGTMTRGMFVTVLGHLAGVNAEEYAGPSQFSDVPEDAYYAPYVAWAVKYGVTAGTGGGKFSPNALIDRQQMATFFVNYFEKFGVKYATGANITTKPADLSSVASWARSSVLKLWKEGLLSGDGVNFMPRSNATRAQAAMLCMLLDDAVDTWYAVPKTGSSGGGGSNTYSVRFYDGSRLVDTLYAPKGKPLGKVPTTAKTSKMDGIFQGWYTDEALTTPFYAEEPVTGNLSVYAKYTEFATPEPTPGSFAQMDQSPDLSFTVVCTLDIPAPVEPSPDPDPDPGETPGEGETPDGGGDPGEVEEPVDPGFTLDQRVVELLDGIVLTPKDGSAPVELEFEAGENNTCIISAVGGFKEGASYELTLPEGLNFQNSEGETMPDSVRTAAFTIKKEAVANLRMNDEIQFIQDTDELTYTVNGRHYDVLTPSLVTGDGGSFSYSGGSFDEGDILCFYKDTNPEQRDYRSGDGYLDDPEVYVRVTGVSGETVTFTALDEEDYQSMYEVPDNFPILGPLPELTDGGTLTLTAEDDDGYALDVNAYKLMMGAKDGTLANAEAKLSKGDFISIYVSQESIDGEEDIYFGKVDSVSGGVITYERCSVEDIEKSMDLYVQPAISGGDLVTPEVQQEIEDAVSQQVAQSDFAEEAAYLLAGAAIQTDSFQTMEAVQSLRFTDARGRTLSGEEISRLGARSVFDLTRPVDVDVKLITNGDQLHFKNEGVQLAVTVKANFAVEAEDGIIEIALEASFVQEVALGVTANGELVWKKILGFIPVPIGVKVGAAVDVKSFTGVDVDALVRTQSVEGVEDLLDISAELNEMLDMASDPMMDMDDYSDQLTGLMTQYSKMLEQETDWVQLVEEQIFQQDFVFYGLAIGVSADFVVHTDLNIAIGASLNYEVGKRYSFWFQIGLFSPSAGSSTMDLIDEQFAFQFYVMGKLGMKMGIKGAVALGIGSTSVASVGLALELGPYIRLYGFFIYECERTREANTDRWNFDQRLGGALYMELGLYLIVSFEAQALGLFEYTHDFVNEEFPLLHAGEEKYPYAFQYDPPEDDMVRVIDSDLSTPVVTMELPEEFRAVAYCDLTTGALSSQVFDYDHYNISLSNPAFSFDPETGMISVEVPENTRFMSCDLTLTYKYGKLAFSPCDMQVSIPLVWSNMPEEELSQLYTASIRVGNNTDGYEIAWSKRVHKGEEFTLPTEAELKKRIAFNDAKYEGGLSFPDAGRTDTLITDKSYDCTVEYKDYEITVSGIQDENGSSSSQTFTTQYGKPFDFSELESTGADRYDEDPDQSLFTKFAGVTTTDTINGQVIDLNQPVSGSFARMLDAGEVNARAEYENDSVLATYHFVGLTVEDGLDRVRKGTASTYQFNDVALENNAMVFSVTPELGKMDASTDYFLDCKPLSGTYSIHVIEFESNGGDPVDTITQVGGSVLPNLPEPERIGYTFLGWYSDEELTTRFREKNMSETEDTTLYAAWKANEYTITFHVEADETVSETSRTVTFDQTYGGDDNTPLPKPKRPGYGFRGWHTARVGGTQIKAEDVVKTASDQTLYAHWEPLQPIPADMFLYETTLTGTYTGSAFTLGDPTQVKTLDNLTFADFKLKYERQADQYYSTTKSYKSLTNAGTYNVVIYREEDDYYEAYEQVCSNVAIIERADSGDAGYIYLKGKDPGFNFLTIEASSYESDMGETPSFTYYASETNGGEPVSNSYGTDTVRNLRANTQYYVKAKVTNHLNYEEAWTDYQLVTVKTLPIGTEFNTPDLSLGSKTFHVSTIRNLIGVYNFVRNNEDFSGYTIILDNDLDLYEYSKENQYDGILEWNPIGTADRPFRGTFDGGNHTIRGLSATGDYAGLFGYVNGATIKNLKIEDSYFEGTVAAGAVVGQAVNSTVDNCHNVHTTIVGPSGGADSVIGIGGDSNCTTNGKVYYN